MKYISHSILLLICLTVLFASFVLAQENQNISANDKGKQEIQKLENEWLSSYLRGDKTTFDRIVAEDFIGTDESGTVRNKTQERELIQTAPASLNVSMANSDVQVRIYENTAVVTGLITQKTKLGTQENVGFKSRFTDTFVKRNGRWQVVGRHYSRIPAERKTVKLNEKVLDAYVGRYELAPNVFLSISKRRQQTF